MNKDMWNIAFNKANDPSFMNVRELNKKILSFTEERDKRLNEKYVEFCNSLECPGHKALFLKYFPTSPHYESKKENFEEIDFILGRPNSIFLTVDLKRNETRWYLPMRPMQMVNCGERDCQKILEYMRFLEEAKEK